MPPLHAAASRGDTAAIKRLLAQGEPIDERFTEPTPGGRKNATPLIVATDADQPEAARILMEAGARERNAALQVAITQGSLRAFREILNQRTDGIEPLDIQSAFWKAVGMGPPECVQLLIEAGADVNGRCTHENGDTPLMHVFPRASGATIADMLLANGADPTLHNDLGETILHRSSQYCNFHLASVGLAAGLSPDLLAATGTPRELWRKRCRDKRAPWDNTPLE